MVFVCYRVHWCVYFCWIIQEIYKYRYCTYRHNAKTTIRGKYSHGKTVQCVEKDETVYLGLQSFNELNRITCKREQ